MNLHSLRKTLPQKDHRMRMTLHGYRRKMNAPVGRHIYLNIIPSEGSSIDGVVIEVNDQELSRLIERETGYELVEVTAKVVPMLEKVYAFVAPDLHHKDHTILQTYVDTCLHPLAEHERRVWFEETIIENPIIDDRDLDGNMLISY